MAYPSEDLVPLTVACELLGGSTSPLNPSTLYRGIKSGRYPAPLKLGPGTARWRRSELMAVLNRAADAREGKAA